MNKCEVKKMLRRRDSLLELYINLDNDSNDDNISISTIDIYKNGCDSISKIMTDIDNQLLKYAKGSSVGEWLLQIKGITPDIAAGLLAYFDITDKECAAQFIKFSGADNINSPHNNNVRLLMDKLTENFKAEPDSLYGQLNSNRFVDLLEQEDVEISTARIRADRYMGKIFISHLFEEMYREEHNGKLPERHNTNRLIILPEVPYTK